MPSCRSRTEQFPARQLCDPLKVEQSTKRNWYVTFEVQPRRMLPNPRHPRLTKTFETEVEAKLFAKEKLDQGLVVTAGSLNPHAPKQIIPSSAMSIWLGSVLDQAKGSNNPSD